ncbi:MAG: 16S rRNA (cytidine(1402)-2'-O)-methyltransferase [Pseudobdellovibrio sp.]
MLYLVATPIGDIQEITIRALKILKEADIILCESTKETSKLFKQLDIKVQKYEILNEHSTAEDLKNLVTLCEQHTVALVSDCGTPGFCDPGNDLIRICRLKKIEVKSILGASSLMGLLSLSSRKLNEFLFRGFLPAESESRTKEWQKLKSEKKAIILMDTPYRLKKTIAELDLHLPKREALLALNLSQENELILEGKAQLISKNLNQDKAEFMLLIYPDEQ